VLRGVHGELHRRLVPGGDVERSGRNGRLASRVAGDSVALGPIRTVPGVGLALVGVLVVAGAIGLG